MWKYHLFVWTVSGIFALTTGLNNNINGYWFVANDLDKSAICWIKAYKNTVSSYAYIMFYIPLMFLYIFSVASMYIAYRRLRNGISNTIIHRMRALVINALNVLIYILYWFFLGMILIGAYAIKNPLAAIFFERLLVYLIAAKGVSSIIIWILTEDVSFSLKKKQRDREVISDIVDLSSVLRSELLFFATGGIRNCAHRANELSASATTQTIRLHHKAQKKINLSPSFFFFLIAGREKERRHIAVLASETRKQASLGGIEVARISELAESNPMMLGLQTSGELEAMEFGDRFVFVLLLYLSCYRRI